MDQRRSQLRKQWRGHVVMKKMYEVEAYVKFTTVVWAEDCTEAHCEAVLIPWSKWDHEDVQDTHAEETYEDASRDD